MKRSRNAHPMRNFNPERKTTAGRLNTTSLPPASQTSLRRQCSHGAILACHMFTELIKTVHTATVTFQLAITELLEDMGLEDENTIAVTLVPRKGGEARNHTPSHAADNEYIAKYQLATSRMRALDNDPNNPLGFKQQANIHCAYCNGAYKVGGKELQVHFSWLFFPFHRWYLYFYERILGSLINDPTFAFPYWNWDHPKGICLPAMFDHERTFLYDEKRNQSPRIGTIIDLGLFGDEVQTTQLQMMTNN
ncbi:Polyphenol oxidase B, chloroplastic [Capsicum chinense]|nr:Polyphenol oxidase B, chloroplastic [Capsicum chinense]